VRAPTAPGWRAYVRQLRALKDAIAAKRGTEQAERAIPEEQFTQASYEGGGRESVENRDEYLSIITDRCERARFKIPSTFERFFDEADARREERWLLEQAEEDASEGEDEAAPKRKPKYPIPAYLGEEGYARVSGWLIDRCLPLMSPAVAKLLLYCSRLANKEGHFWVTQEAVATMLGHDGLYARQAGRRAMRTLIEADIVRIIRLGRKMGKSGTATEYAFTPPADLYLGNVEAALKGRWGGLRAGAGRPRQTAHSPRS